MGKNRSIGLNQIRAILSTGQGRLHLVQSACVIKGAGADIRIIQGWIPNRWPTWLVDFLGRMVGSKKLSYGMAKRRPPGFDDSDLKACSAAEFAIQGLLLLARFGCVNQSKAARLGWTIFGLQSRRHIGNASILHVRSGAGQGGAIRKAKRLGMKVVVDHSIAHPARMRQLLTPELDGFGKECPFGELDPFWALVLRDCMEADCLLVNSDFVKDTFVEQGFPTEKICVVYCGVREDFFGLKGDYRNQNPTRLTFIGSFGLRKGARHLLSALPLLGDLPFELNIVGTVEPEAKLLLKRSNLNRFIRLHGHLPQDQLKSILSDTDVFVFPSLVEGCANSCMEALAAGLPVIATKETGTPIMHGRDGWIVPAASASALAQAILLLSADEKLRSTLGRAAASKIKSHYTWRQYGKSVLELYGRLLAT